MQAKVLLAAAGLVLSASALAAGTVVTTVPGATTTYTLDQTVLSIKEGSNAIDMNKRFGVADSYAIFAGFSPPGTPNHWAQYLSSAPETYFEPYYPNSLQPAPRITTLNNGLNVDFLGYYGFGGGAPSGTGTTNPNPETQWHDVLIAFQGISFAAQPGYVIDHYELTASGNAYSQGGTVRQMGTGFYLTSAQGYAPSRPLISSAPPVFDECSNLCGDGLTPWLAGGDFLVKQSFANLASGPVFKFSIGWDAFTYPAGEWGYYLDNISIEAVVRVGSEPEPPPVPEPEIPDPGPVIPVPGSVTPVPEPSTVALSLLGLAAVGLRRRWRVAG